MISSLRRRFNGTRWLVGATAAVGIGLLAWTVASVDVDLLSNQLHSIRIVLPLVLVLAAVRFAFQAEGWRLAAKGAEGLQRGETFAAVIAGESAGYFALGPVSREPIKASFIAHRVDQRVGLAAAVAERVAYSAAAAALSILGLGILAIRHGHGASFAMGVLVFLAVIAIAWRMRSEKCRAILLPQGRKTTLATLREMADDLRNRRAAIIGMATFALLQEASNVFEAYLVMALLGATPSLAGIIVLEGVSRLVNAAGQFIPGKLGVSEASSTALAAALNLGGSYGLSLALARRARSLAWGAIGLALLAHRAATGLPSSDQGRRSAAGVATIACLNLAASR